MGGEAFLGGGEVLLDWGGGGDLPLLATSAGLFFLEGGGLLLRELALREEDEEKDLERERECELERESEPE